MLKKIPDIILVIITLILAVISWFLLPDTPAVQIGVDGQITNTMPKLSAIALPVVISFSGTVIHLIGKQSRSKGYALSLIGIVVLIVTLFFNR
ncbi:MAG: DUF1648 domain-containing protein [Bulleidia sp.]